jgi:hypothetical protein
VLRFLVSVKRPYVQHRVKESIKPEALITRTDRRVKGWLRNECALRIGWAVSEGWVDGWAEGECGFMKLMK